jgi:crotonobetainyl-CoA:carnitine CoA-transferase CaiB-like acyl-CoA transferase
MTAPLIADGIRVVEVADFVFVPVVGAILASWGANVVKVEHHERGDAMRGLSTRQTAGVKPHIAGAVNTNLMNRGKRSIGINLASPEGRKVLYSLIENADVFLTNRTQSVIEKLGITVDDVRQVNPHVIYARGTAHGSKGPEGARGGYDTADFWYRGGVAAGAHVPDAELPPSLPSPGFGDITSGHHLAAGVLGALYHRERTGEALSVEVSLLGSALWSMSTAVSLSGQTGKPLMQNPHGTSTNPLHDIYRTKDGFVNMCTMQSHPYLNEFCDLMGLDGVTTDERFSSHTAVAAHSAELTQIIATAIGAMTSDEFKDRMVTYSGQWAPVQDSVDVAMDPQVIANGYIGSMPTTDGSSIEAVVPPVQFNGSPAALTAAPAFNEHGDEILGELGISVEEMIELKIAGAVT